MAKEPRLDGAGILQNFIFQIPELAFDDSVFDCGAEQRIARFGPFALNERKDRLHQLYAIGGVAHLKPPANLDVQIGCQLLQTFFHECEMICTLPGKTASLSEIMEFLDRAGSPENVAGMARYGIRPAKVYGVPSPVLRQLARVLGKNTALASQLWDTGVHDARFLGALVANPKDITSEELDRWAAMFDSWALCDSTCIQLIRKTPHAWDKVRQWLKSEEEFVRRASIALLATLAVHDKKAPQSQFDEGRRMLAKLSVDKRPLIQKAIKWALRSMDARQAKLETRSPGEGASRQKPV